jgi:hypothetical protein
LSTVNEYFKKRPSSCTSIFSSELMGISILYI